MVSLSDSEWLTVFFSVVALLLFCVLVCLMVHTMLCAIGEESESNLDVKPVRSVKSNLVLSADRRLVRANNIIRPEIAATQKQEAIKIDIYEAAESTTSSSLTTVTSTAEENTCRALVPVERPFRRQSSPGQSARRAPVPPRRSVSARNPALAPNGLVDIPLNGNLAPKRRPAPFRWCAERRAFVQEDEEARKEEARKEYDQQPPLLMYTGRYRPTTPFADNKFR